LDAFLTYKRLVLEGGQPSAAQLRELLRAIDAGEPEAVERAWAFLHGQGIREAAARVQTGLSSAEVRVIESMAADVAAARVFARPMGLGKLSEVLGGSGQGVLSSAAWATAYVGPGPWGVLGPDLPAHPAQVYEAIGDGLLLVVLLILGRRGPFRAGDGRTHFNLLGWNGQGSAPGLFPERDTT